MGESTKISFCDSTINPVIGCDLRCELYPDICYAAKLAKRFAGRPGWPIDFLHPEYFPGRLEKSQLWSRWPDRIGKSHLYHLPRIIFLGDMADIYSKSAPPTGVWLHPFIYGLNLRHFYLILTKRPSAAVKDKAVLNHPRFFVGTSITTQETIRRAEIMEEEAQRYWLSIEPMMGEINISGLNPGWVVVGSQLGVKQDIAWVRKIRDYCEANHIPFFFKQWGDEREPSLDGVIYHQMPEITCAR